MVWLHCKLFVIFSPFLLLWESQFPSLFSLAPDPCTPPLERIIHFFKMYSQWDDSFHSVSFFRQVSNWAECRRSQCTGVLEYVLFRPARHVKRYSAVLPLFTAVVIIEIWRSVLLGEGDDWHCPKYWIFCHCLDGHVIDTWTMDSWQCFWLCNFQNTACVNSLDGVVPITWTFTLRWICLAMIVIIAFKRRCGGLMVNAWTPELSILGQALARALWCVLGQDTLLS